MKSSSPKLDGDQCTEIDRLQQTVIAHPDRQTNLQAYFNEALAVGQIDRAITVLGQLQAQQPWNHNIRRLIIAGYLQEKRYSQAMEAIETLLAFSKPDDALIDSALAVRKKIGAKTLERLPESRPSISLCMIVRNEQAMLGPCLNSIKPLADEIIVVDTGSDDRSADIARVYGALVYDFKWCDDFSAARNHSIEQANGDWILILDADEVIAAQDHNALRMILAGQNSKSRAFSLQTRNYTGVVNIMDWQPNDHRYPSQETGMGWFPTNKVRLFPKSDQVRFEYPVHELVEPSAQKVGLTIESCDIPIHHYGQINEAKNIVKTRHYFELGYAKLEQLGNDKAALRELAIQAGQLDRWTEAIELWDRFLSLCPGYGEAYANLSGAYWQMGSYEKGMAYAKKAIKANPDLKEAHYNLAVNLLMKRESGEAIDILKALLRKNPSYTGAYFMLAVSLCVQGDQQHSRRLFDTLEKDLSGDVLAMAAEVLSRKFVENGSADFAQLLIQTAGCAK